jgi:hypothetical protein
VATALTLFNNFNICTLQDALKELVAGWQAMEPRKRKKERGALTMAEAAVSVARTITLRLIFQDSNNMQNMSNIKLTPQLKRTKVVIRKLKVMRVINLQVVTRTYGDCDLEVTVVTRTWMAGKR